jgi:hypothetical protein
MKQGIKPIIFFTQLGKDCLIFSRNGETFLKGLDAYYSFLKKTKSLSQKQ